MDAHTSSPANHSPTPSTPPTTPPYRTPHPYPYHNPYLNPSPYAAFETSVVITRFVPRSHAANDSPAPTKSPSLPIRPRNAPLRRLLLRHLSSDESSDDADSVIRPYCPDDDDNDDGDDDDGGGDDNGDGDDDDDGGGDDDGYDCDDDGEGDDGGSECSDGSGRQSVSQFAPQRGGEGEDTDEDEEDQDEEDDDEMEIDGDDSIVDDDDDHEGQRGICRPCNRDDDEEEDDGEEEDDDSARLSSDVYDRLAGEYNSFSPDMFAVHSPHHDASSVASAPPSESDIPLPHDDDDGDSDCMACDDDGDEGDEYGNDDDEDVEDDKEDEEDDGIDEEEDDEEEDDEEDDGNNIEGDDVDDYEFAHIAHHSPTPVTATANTAQLEDDVGIPPFYNDVERPCDITTLMEYATYPPVNSPRVETVDATTLQLPSVAPDIFFTPPLPADLVQDGIDVSKGGLDDMDIVDELMDGTSCSLSDPTGAMTFEQVVQLGDAVRTQQASGSRDGDESGDDGGSGSAIVDDMLVDDGRQPTRKRKLSGRDAVDDGDGRSGGDGAGGEGGVEDGDEGNRCKRRRTNGEDEVDDSGDVWKAWLEVACEELADFPALLEEAERRDAERQYSYDGLSSVELLSS